MKQEPTQPKFPVSQAIYERLLLAYPPPHRAEYGAAMAQLFHDECRDAWKGAPTWGLLKLWLHVLPDLASTSIMERLAELKERKTMTDKLANLLGFRVTPMSTFFRIFVLVFLLVFLVSVAITFILPESYASTARLLVESDSTSERQSLPYDPYFIQTTFQIIQSELVLKPVVNNLNLNVEWGKKYFNGETLKTVETMEILKQRLQLAPVKNTKLIAITVYSDDRNEAAQIANAVAKAYQDYRVEARNVLAADTLATLQRQYEEQEKQIQEAQAEVDAAAGQSLSAQTFQEKQRNLANLLDFHKALFGKIEDQKLAAELPKPTLAQITDTAQPGFAPVRPNKVVNIVLGAILGIFLASAAGAVFAFLSFFVRRTHKAVAA
jgi:uncharacterized protein involved in exopolysaccharide biosynthesis